jgi:hypothetical protein
MIPETIVSMTWTIGIPVTLGLLGLLVLREILRGADVYPRRSVMLSLNWAIRVLLTTFLCICMVQLLAISGAAAITNDAQTHDSTITDDVSGRSPQVPASTETSVEVTPAFPQTATAATTSGVAATSPTEASTVRQDSTAQPTSATQLPPLLDKVNAAMDGLRSGELDATIEDITGLQTHVAVRFDLGENAASARLYALIVSASATGTRSTELVWIGDQQWGRQVGQSWQRGETATNVASVVRSYLPLDLEIPATLQATGTPNTQLSWDDEARNASYVLRVSPDGVPEHITITDREAGSTTNIAIVGWNTPVTIMEPEAPTP